LKSAVQHTKSGNRRGTYLHQHAVKAVSWWGGRIQTSVLYLQSWVSNRFLQHIVHQTTENTLPVQVDIRQTPWLIYFLLKTKLP
jgi:hypothetical protein